MFCMSLAVIPIICMTFFNSYRRGLRDTLNFVPANRDRLREAQEFPSPGKKKNPGFRSYFGSARASCLH